MRFNKSKCKVLHVGRNNGRSLDTFGDVKLDEANGERDLGVSIDEDLKFSSHAQATVAKCNRILGYIRRSVASSISRYSSVVCGADKTPAGILHPVLEAYK